MVAPAVRPGRLATRLITLESASAPVENITVGDSPIGIALNRQGTIAYVADEDSNAVSVVDLKGDRVVATISTGPTPLGVALSPNGNELYVATMAGLDVISTLKDRVTRTVEVGDGSSGVAISPNGAYAYVTAFDHPQNVQPSPSGPSAGGVSIVETSNDRVVGIVGTISAPENIVVSPNGRYVYLDSAWGDGRSFLQVVAVASKKVVATIDQPGYQVSDIAIDPDGSMLYETADQANLKVTVRVLSPSTNRLVGEAFTPNPALSLAFNPKGNEVFLCDGNGTALTVLDPATRQVLETVPLTAAPIGYAPVAIALSPSGRQAFVVHDDLLGIEPGYLNVVNLPA
jgi:YVTN family beta-propeller protein